MGKVGAVLSSVILLFLLWLALTMSQDPQELILGGVLCVLIAVATHGVFTGNMFRLLRPRRFAALLEYMGYLLYQMARANIDVASRVLRLRPVVNPGIVKADARLSSSRARAILANSITLTPGTLSVDLRDSSLYVHWISLPEGDVSAETQHMVDGFARRLEKIFE